MQAAHFPTQIRAFYKSNRTMTVRRTRITVHNMPSEKIRGLGNSQTYYYLQTLLTGDTETRRKSRTFSMAEPLAVTVLKFFSRPNFLKSFFS